MDSEIETYGRELGWDARVESIRHAALHLGELRLTRDLARREEC
jgi:hypothetical protein